MEHQQTRLDVFAKNLSSLSHRKPLLRGPVIRLVGALPIRARTVTSHGAADLLGNPDHASPAPVAAKAIKALGWFATSEDKARLQRAAALLGDPAYDERVVREQIAATERCNITYTGFSCKGSKAHDLRAYLRNTNGKLGRGWSPEEDDKIKRIVAAQGGTQRKSQLWANVATEFNAGLSVNDTRRGKHLRTRWIDYLDPALSRVANGKGV